MPWDSGHPLATLLRILLARPMLDLTTMNLPVWDDLSIDTFQTANINGPPVEWIKPFLEFLRCGVTWPAKGQDAAHLAEVVHGGARAPTIDRKVIQWSEQTEIGFWNAEDQGTALATDRTVTDANMVDLRINLEAYQATMTRTDVDWHDRV